MNIKNNRKLKYGSLAVALTCVVVALIIACNMIFTLLASRFGWFIDMTKEQIFALSDSTVDVLEGYKEMEGLEVKIIFCQEEDLIESNYYLRIIHNMAKLFAEEFNFVTIEYVDVNRHPGAVEQYKKTSQTSIYTTSVIIACGDASRVYQRQAFYVFDEDDSSTPIAFDGEYKFVSAILSMIGDNPIAYFTTGHGENTEGSSMYKLFEEAGYVVKTIDLTKETPDEDAQVIVINNPKYDFAGADQSVNEIQKLSTFQNGMGNLMVFLDTNADNTRFTELNEYLYEWGMVFEDSAIYDYDNSLTQDGTELVATYVADGKLGASLTQTMRDLSSPPKIIVNNARPIKSTFASNMSDYSQRQTSAVLTTSTDGTAVAVPFHSATNEGTKGIYNLMMVCEELRTINNVNCYNYVLCAGTASFADDKYIGNSIYGNRDLIFNAMKSFGKQNVPLDLDFKFFDSEGLDLTSAQANQWTVILCAVLPAAVFAAGIVVFIRRRHL